MHDVTGSETYCRREKTSRIEFQTIDRVKAMESLKSVRLPGVGQLAVSVTPSYALWSLSMGCAFRMGRISYSGAQLAPLP